MKPNNISFCLQFFMSVLVSGMTPACSQTVSDPSGPVAVKTYEWTDPARGREVPVKIYYPETGKGPFPVIVFSHGLGGSRDGYEYLGRYWAGHGYVSVHLQHLGSDTGVWKGKLRPMMEMKKAAANPLAALDRPLDVRFAIDQLERLNREDTLFKHRLDLTRLGMAGHSFGAWTTLAVAGQRSAGPFGRRGSAFLDPRIKAAIPMSAPVPRQRSQLDKIYGDIRIPCFHMTGTLDNSPIGETIAADRRIPYDHIKGADQYLVTFTGGDHMIFSGRRIKGRTTAAKDAIFQDLICKGSTAFWDAWLKNDAAAKRWLTCGGFEKALGKNGTFEEKIHK